MMSVQRPAVRKSDPRLLAKQESRNMLLSDAATVPMPDVEEQVLPPAEPDITIRPPSLWQRPPQRRTIPIILTISCLLLLISGSLLAYISLNWSVNATTSDGASWLGVSSTSGHLEPGQQANLSITINAAELQPNPYQGLLTFSYGSLTKQMAISLTVSPPPMAAISLKPAVVTLQTIKGTNPGPQTFAITNSGNAILNWAIKEDANGASYAPVTPTSGSVDPGRSATITISPSVAPLGAGTWDAAITITDSDPGTTVPLQNVAVHIIVKDQAVVTVSSSGSMKFNNTTTLSDTSQLLVITNTGSATLNWVAEPAPSSATWLYADISSGSLAPGGEVVVNVHCNSSQLPPGSYTATLVVSDSDTGTPVQSQSISITLTVS